MQRYGDYYSEPRVEEITRLLKETREKVSMPPPKKYTKVEQQARSLQRIESRIDANRLRQAPRDAYVPVSRLPVLKEKLDRQADRPKPDYYKLKQEKRMKQEALAKYDAKYGTKLAKPKPASYKYFEKGVIVYEGPKSDPRKIGPFVSWPEVVASVMSDPKKKEMSMSAKIREASDIWREMGEKFIRPDIAKKEMKAEEAQRTESEDDRRKRELAEEKRKEAAKAAAKLAKARAAAKKQALYESPERYADIVFQETASRKIRQQQKEARKYLPTGKRAPPIARYIRIGDKEYLMTRAQMNRAFFPESQGGPNRNERTLQQIWDSGRFYDDKGESAARAARGFRVEPLAPYTGYSVDKASRKPVPVAGSGVFSRRAGAEDIKEIMERFGITPQQLGYEVERVPQTTTR